MFAPDPRICTLDGIPVFVNELLAKNTILRGNEDTPQEYILVDSIDTLKDALSLTLSGVTASSTKAGRA